MWQKSLNNLFEINAKVQVFAGCFPECYLDGQTHKDNKSHKHRPAVRQSSGRDLEDAAVPTPGEEVGDTFRAGHRPTPKHHTWSGSCWVLSAFLRGAATRQGGGRRPESLWVCRRVGEVRAWARSREEQGPVSWTRGPPLSLCFAILLS